MTGCHSAFDAHVKIESTENGIVKVRDEKGEKGELRRISQLPSLPPLLNPVTMTQEQLGKLATHKPQPEYPMQARERCWVLRTICNDSDGHREGRSDRAKHRLGDSGFGGNKRL